MKSSKIYIITSLTFLLATSALFGYGSIKGEIRSNEVSVTNASNFYRKSATIEISWQSLKNLNASSIVVHEADSGKEIPSQVIYQGGTVPLSIIFQINIAPKSTQKFIIGKGTPTKYPEKVYGRQVPERLDDFAWENDKVAFRMYGEALENKEGMAKGIDFWAKRTSKFIVNELYKKGNYHHDNGDAVDAYHVGLTLGAGDTEPIIGAKIIYPINYSSYEILDNGPIRITFKLIYKPFDVNGKQVRETKTISLDAGSQMNQIVNHYQGDGTLELASGVTKHENKGVAKVDKKLGYVAYWDPADGGLINGQIGVGIICQSKRIKEFKETKQHLLIISFADKKGNLSYYQGAAWSKSENFKDADAWFNYLKQFVLEVESPLKINLKIVDSAH
ncbi:MAG: DUF4861 family protein [Pedobacter sp.]|nr:DUF4861 family protein [Pedobacter sp.]